MRINKKVISFANIVFFFTILINTVSNENILKLYVCLNIFEV